MVEGKIPELVLKRSVIGNVTARREDVSFPHVAGDASVVCIGGKQVAATMSGVVDYTKNDIEFYTFYKCFNNMLAAKTIPKALELGIILPRDSKEKEIKEIVKKYDFLCGRHGMQISGGHTQVTDSVNRTITLVTMMGEKVGDNIIDIDAGKDVSIIMTKAIGIEGTAIIARDKEEILRQRFNGRFCDACLEFKKHISIYDEAVIAMKEPNTVLHDVSASGVFASMWELASSLSMGAVIELKKIPVWQETVELTELFDVNPYKMASQGALLIATDNAESLMDRFDEAEIPAAVVGKLVKGNDKIVINDDETRYLEPPRGDDIYLI